MKLGRRRGFSWVSFERGWVGYGEGLGLGVYYEDLPLLCVRRRSEVVQSIGEAFVLINWSFGPRRAREDINYNN